VVLEGSKVKLSCNATNDPDAVHPLQIHWYNSYGDQVTSDGEHVLVYNFTDPDSDQAQSMILFDHVNRTDAGIYTCRAFNDPNSTVNENITLTVECKYSNYAYYVKNIMLKDMSSINKFLVFERCS